MFVPGDVIRRRIVVDDEVPLVFEVHVAVIVGEGCRIRIPLIIGIDGAGFVDGLILDDVAVPSGVHPWVQLVSLSELLIALQGGCFERLAAVAGFVIAQLSLLGGTCGPLLRFRGLHAQGLGTLALPDGLVAHRFGASG